MKKIILKIIISVIVIVVIYFGWKVVSFGNSIKNFGESFTEALTSKPIVKQEIYSPDSLHKIGVYRFLVPGEGSFEASNYEVPLIDTSMEYPKEGNIINDKEFEPIVTWISSDSILITLDSTDSGFDNYSIKVNGKSILINGND